MSLLNFQILLVKTVRLNVVQSLYLISQILVKMSYLFLLILRQCQRRVEERVGV